ncbi:LysR family transcriptional regulator [Sphingomonas sp. TDK1]|uniref:LysR family transcriptional regulator n=1 Tax=Sphingomonas sp. TDK1 TaxID=453247 RepID=UPI0007D8CEFB|nr:LysR family transcriptional regulator [Sphingomonas sp. TDK1]OAN63565.1 LysR family transcriptional regulator [Sphingomonas sp. TDK1]
MDRLEAMALLVATVECGSMSAAGRKLAVPVATLSRKLSELEAHLGVRLLTRSTRRLELTEAGAAYLAASRRILEEVAEAEREATGEYLQPRGELVLTSPLSFGRLHVLPIVNAFLSENPEISVRLGLSDQQMDLMGEHIDLAFRIGNLADSQLVGRRIGDIRWVVVGAPDFLAAHGTPSVPAEAAALPCVGVDYMHLASSWRFRDLETGAEHLQPVRPRLAVSTAHAAIDAAAAGMGLTQTVLYEAAPAIAAGKLKIVLPAYEARPLPLSIVYPGRGRMPLKTRSFLDFAAPTLAAEMQRLDAIARGASL